MEELRIVFCGKCHRIGYMIGGKCGKYDFDSPYSTGFDGWYLHKRFCYKYSRNGEPDDAHGAIEIKY